MTHEHPRREHRTTGLPGRSAEERSRAVRYLAAHAAGPAELKEWLAMLGLDPAEGNVVQQPSQT
ncbi:hypothetical protein [Saccharopolyspora rectivirgula]|jgi:hypothetical protein|uniref:hypothetical protein n=1 Tax=Saccharopolyspora rectivirgula TaxID=28042 RepID=UPI0003F5FA34|nr:hypothetical protein [Saccharopolyspora rectivirgula]MCC5698490.1 hypothetical protein [Klebsiella pneumoniae]